MKTSITPKLLSHLARQINSGDAIWALFTLNEYSEGCPDALDLCLREKARKKLASMAEVVSPEITEAALRGERLSELSPGHRQEVRMVKISGAKRARMEVHALIPYHSRISAKLARRTVTGRRNQVSGEVRAADHRSVLARRNGTHRPVFELRR